MTVGIAGVLAISAAIRYPGGTALDSTTRGYSFSRNFLSDLGMTVAYNYQSNRLGAAFFVVSLGVLVVGLGSIVVHIARLLAAHGTARRWARSAAVFALLASVAFAGVAVTPENQVMDTHVALTFWAWRLVPVAMALMAVASFYTPAVRRRAAAIWLVASVSVAAYAAFMTWGPSVSTTDGLGAQVIAQKLVTVLMLATLLLISYEGDRAALSAMAENR